jgi:hypothetical protein
MAQQGTVVSPAVKEAAPTMPASVPKPTDAQAQAKAGLARILTNGEFVYEDKFEPKNILLTGGAGFIGSHVAILLATKYPAYKVRALCVRAGTLVCVWLRIEAASHISVANTSHHGKRDVFTHMILACWVSHHPSTAIG